MTRDHLEPCGLSQFFEPEARKMAIEGNFFQKAKCLSLLLEFGAGGAITDDVTVGVWMLPNYKRPSLEKKGDTLFGAETTGKDDFFLRGEPTVKASSRHAVPDVTSTGDLICPQEISHELAVCIDRVEAVEPAAKKPVLHQRTCETKGRQATCARAVEPWLLAAAATVRQLFGAKRADGIRIDDVEKGARSVVGACARKHGQDERRELGEKHTDVNHVWLKGFDLTL